MPIRRAFRRRPAMRPKRRMGARRPVRRTRPVRSKFVRNPTLGATTVVLNNRFNKPITVNKSYRGWNVVGGTGVDVTQKCTFDPSGTYDTQGLQMPEWVNYYNTYDQYKVHYIKITMQYLTTGAVTGLDNIVLYGRYNYDRNITLTMSSIQQKSFVKMHTFTPEHPIITFKVYPRVNILQQTSGATLALQSERVSKVGWTDVDHPCELQGFMYVCPLLPTNVSIRIDVEYCVSFRYSL